MRGCRATTRNPGPTLPPHHCRATGGQSRHFFHWQISGRVRAQATGRRRQSLTRGAQLPPGTLHGPLRCTARRCGKELAQISRPSRMPTVKPARRSRSSLSRLVPGASDHTARSRTAPYAGARWRSQIPSTQTSRRLWPPSLSQDFQPSAPPRSCAERLAGVIHNGHTAGRGSHSPAQERSRPSRRVASTREGCLDRPGLAAASDGRLRRRGAPMQQTCPNREFAELFDRFNTSAHESRPRCPLVKRLHRRMRTVEPYNS